MAEPKIIGIDLSNGIETHVEGYWKDGILHITDHYEIIDHDLGAGGGTRTRTPEESDFKSLVSTIPPRPRTRRVPLEYPISTSFRNFLSDQ